MCSMMHFSFKASFLKHVHFHYNYKTTNISAYFLQLRLAKLTFSSTLNPEDTATNHLVSQSFLKKIVFQLYLQYSTSSCLLLVLLSVKNSMPTPGLAAIYIKCSLTSKSTTRNMWKLLQLPISNNLSIFKVNNIFTTALLLSHL